MNKQVLKKNRCFLASWTTSNHLQLSPSNHEASHRTSVGGNLNEAAAVVTTCFSQRLNAEMEELNNAWWIYLFCLDSSWEYTSHTGDTIEISMGYMTHFYIWYGLCVAPIWYIFCFFMRKIDISMVINHWILGCQDQTITWRKTNTYGCVWK